MTDDIKAIRDALADPDLTHGEWVACGPSFGDPLPRYLNEVVRPDDVDGGDTVARAMEGMEGGSTADMAYIAAVHPERIARLLDALDVAKADAARYKQVLDDALDLLREDLDARTKAAAELLAALELFERGCDGPAFEDWTNGNGDLCGPAIYAAIEGMKAAMKGTA